MAGVEWARTVLIQRLEKPSEEVTFGQSLNEGEGRTSQALETAMVGIYVEFWGHIWEGGCESRSRRLSCRGWRGQNICSKGGHLQ